MHPVPGVEFLEALPYAAQNGPPLFGREIWIFLDQTKQSGSVEKIN
jgi:hypothetical protein